MGNADSGRQASGSSFMRMLQGVFWVAKWLARILECVVLSVATIVDGVASGAKLGWQITTEVSPMLFWNDDGSVSLCMSYIL